MSCGEEMSAIRAEPSGVHPCGVLDGLGESLRSSNPQNQNGPDTRQAQRSLGMRAMVAKRTSTLRSHNSLVRESHKIEYLSPNWAPPRVRLLSWLSLSRLRSGTIPGWQIPCPCVFPRGQP